MDEKKTCSMHPEAGEMDEAQMAEHMKTMHADDMPAGDMPAEEKHDDAAAM